MYQRSSHLSVGCVCYQRYSSSPTSNTATDSICYRGEDEQENSVVDLNVDLQASPSHGLDSEHRFDQSRQSTDTQKYHHVTLPIIKSPYDIKSHKAPYMRIMSRSTACIALKRTNLGRLKLLMIPRYTPKKATRLHELLTLFYSLILHVLVLHARQLGPCMRKLLPISVQIDTYIDRQQVPHPPGKRNGEIDLDQRI